VLIDIGVPAYDGYKLIAALRREADPFVPIAALTALGDVEAKRRAIDAGADELLTKPIVATDVEVRLQTLLRLRTAVLAAERLEAQLGTIATIDPATRLYNRRVLDDHLERELARARRYGHPLAVLAIGIDRTRRVDVSRADDASHRAMIGVADVLRASLRQSDFLARREAGFTVLAPDTSAEQALRVGERLRQAVAGRFRGRDDLGRVTISIGVATTRSLSATTPTSLLELADDALASAARRGANRSAVVD
jgi:diguanylate cyclase (GGDEF)-like protein